MCWFYSTRGRTTPPSKPHPKKELKVVVRRDYEQEDIPDGVHIIDMPDQRVDQAMGELHKQWCPHQANLIVAPTGSYKTTYIGSLIRWHASRGEETLVIGPRDMLRFEHKKRLPALAGSKWGKVVKSGNASDEDIEDIRGEGVDLALELTREFRDVNLEVMTFQELARQYKMLNLMRYKLVVIDEAHRTHSDALFDTSADFVLENIPEWFSGACRVYLTATPGAILDDLVRVEKASFAYCPGTRPCAKVGCGQIRMYRFPNHFDGLSLHYYREPDEMVAFIKAHPGEKFIIFVSRREDTDYATRSYCAKLKAAGIEVEYLDSNEKGSDTWKSLRKQNKFSSQVLVTTKVLDVGFSIVDDALHHVVLETLDKTEFIQELGRKRRCSGEHVHVYVKAVPQNVLKSRLNQVEHALSICKAGFNSQDFPNHRLLLEGWNDEDPARLYSKLLIPASADRFKVRLSAHHALLWQQGTLNKLIRMSELYGDDSAYPRLVHEWLEDPDGYSEANWLGYDATMENRRKLVEFLENWCDVPMTGEDHMCFLAQLQIYIAQLTVEQHDGTRQLKDRAINNRLESLKLPFRIDKDGTNYVLRRTP